MDEDTGDTDSDIGYDTSDMDGYVNITTGLDGEFKVRYHVSCTQPTFYRSESDKSLIMSDLQIDTDLFGTILIQV